MLFLCDSFSAAKIAYKLASSIEVKEKLRILLYSILEKFFFEVISHAALGPNESLSYVWHSINEYFTLSYESSIALFTKLIKDPIQFFNYIVKCPEQAVRKLIGKAVAGATVQLMKDTKTTLLKEFLNIVTELIGYELSSNWTKFEQFFEMLKEIVISANEELLKWFYEKDLLTRLLDFYLEKKSPVSSANVKRYEMGNISQSPNFRFLMETVSFLALRGNVTDKNNQKIPSPFKEGTLEVEISPSAVTCLQYEDLIPKYLKSGGKLEDLEIMLTHLCCMNKKMSKSICKTIIKEINNYEVSKLSQYVSLIFNLILIKDALQLQRIEWLFGFTQPLCKNGYGLACTNDIEDEVNYYVSTLSPDERAKPLLQLIWSDRRHTEKFVADTLKLLLTSTIFNEATFNYLKELAPPCYLYATYCDWVPCFLDVYSKTIQCLTIDVKEKTELVGNVRKLYNDYQEKIVRERRPYMVGLTRETKQLEEKKQVIDDLKLTVTEIMVEVYDSKPTGSYNAALTGNYLISHFKHCEINANTRFEPKQESNTVVGNNTSSANDKENSEVRKESEDETKHKEDKKNESEDTTNESNKEQAKNEEKEEIPKEPINREEKAEEVKTEIIQKEELKNEGNTEKANVKETNAPLYRILPVFHRIDINYDGMKKIEVKIAIVPKGEVNFYCPMSKCKYEGANFNKTMFVIQKKDVDKDFGDYEITLQRKFLESDTTTVPKKPEGITCMHCTLVNSADKRYCDACNSDLS